MMSSDQIKQKLAEIDPAILQEFIADLYQRYPELGDRIEALLLSNDPAALAKALGKRIQSLRRGRKFIDYRASYDFSRDMEVLLADIESGLLETSPKHAFELTDKFLATAEQVLNRVDDSGGNVGEVYREAVLLWLTAAKDWPDAGVDWVERVYLLYQQNDYGVLDPLLPNAHILLTEDQLKQLAWRYEGALRKALKTPDEPDKLNYSALSNAVAMGSVAQALGDPALYERSILIRSPQPNNLQMKGICENFLQYGQPEAALRYLEQEWERRFEYERLQLLDKVYIQTGQREKLKQIRHQIFQIVQCHASLMNYLDVLDEQEKARACDEAIEMAEQGDDLLLGAELLLNLGHSQRAEALVLSRQQELAKCFYGGLAPIAKAFEEVDCRLAATACYRALLLDILNNGRSTAYSHGVRYFKKLAVLAGRIQAFEPLLEHQAFVQQLRAAHGRKNSFWGQL